jgi:hypothetical protein
MAQRLQRSHRGQKAQIEPDLCGQAAVMHAVRQLLLTVLKPLDLGYIVWSRFGSLTPLVLLPVHTERQPPRARERVLSMSG